MIEALSEEDSIFGGLKLSRNRGHQNALLAGLMTAKDHADVVISMDADLQDDIEAVDAMIEAYNNGAEIVYGVRSSRASDTYLKRNTALMFYKLMKHMGVDTVYNHADYRLMSKKALQSLAEFKEVNLFLRGLIPLIGYKTAVVEYERSERFAGESKYPISKMLNFAIDGITSLSVKLIRFISIFGVFVSILSVVIFIYTLIQWLRGSTVQGWAFIMISIWFLGGCQILAIGIIGEYIGKNYIETKARPRYIIEKEII
jgi:glycosyltransferase involved in cell wall biosynthesis